jgi:hypothetical protein
MVGPDWADFSGDVTGTAFSGGSLTFRPGTAYAKLIILPTTSNTARRPSFCGMTCGSKS